MRTLFGISIACCFAWVGRFVQTVNAITVPLVSSVPCSLMPWLLSPPPATRASFYTRC
jgi:hypothetical protein